MLRVIGTGPNLALMEEVEKVHRVSNFQVFLTEIYFPELVQDVQTNGDRGRDPPDALPEARSDHR